MQVTKIGHVSDGQRQVTGHIIVIQVKDLQIFELRELRWEGAIENIVRKIKKPKARNDRELGWDGAGELVGGEGELLEEAKVSNIRGESTGEVKTGEVKGSNVTASRVTGNTMPRAERVGGVPRSECRLGIINGGFDREKGLVFRHDTG